YGGNGAADKRGGAADDDRASTDGVFNQAAGNEQTVHVLRGAVDVEDGVVAQECGNPDSLRGGKRVVHVQLQDAPDGTGETGDALGHIHDSHAAAAFDDRSAAGDGDIQRIGPSLGGSKPYRSIVGDDIGDGASVI